MDRWSRKDNIVRKKGVCVQQCSAVQARMSTDVVFNSHWKREPGSSQVDLPTRIKHDLRDEGIVWHHHSHRPE